MTGPVVASLVARMDLKVEGVRHLVIGLLVDLEIEERMEIQKEKVRRESATGTAQPMAMAAGGAQMMVSAATIAIGEEMNVTVVAFNVGIARIVVVMVIEVIDLILRRQTRVLTLMLKRRILSKPLAHLPLPPSLGNLALLLSQMKMVFSRHRAEASVVVLAVLVRRRIVPLARAPLVVAKESGRAMTVTRKAKAKAGRARMERPTAHQRTKVMGRVSPKRRMAKEVRKERTMARMRRKRHSPASSTVPP